MGNIIALFDGQAEIAPLLLSAHMDTVEPGRGIDPRIQNGTISSEGATILGADDKSAVAVILEVLACLREQAVSHGPLDVVLSVCEEIGLLGVNNLDYDLLRARQGYVLDTSNQRALVTRAPAANQLKFTVTGRAAHAGGAPKRVSTPLSWPPRPSPNLRSAASTLKPPVISGSSRGGWPPTSYRHRWWWKGRCAAMMNKSWRRSPRIIVSAFEQVVQAVPRPRGDAVPRVDCKVCREFDLLAVTEEHPTVRLARQGGRGILDLPWHQVTSGGGSDANVFARHGITAPVLGTGMQDVHTVDESIRIDDMVESARLLFGIIRRHSGGEFS